MLEILRLVESYVFRRAICDVPTNSLNKTFQNLAGELDKRRYLENLKVVLLLKDSYRRFPRDEEFRTQFAVRDIYNLTNRAELLAQEAQEHDARKEPVDVESYTIEHIMPQTDNISLDWQAELGEHWRDVRDRYAPVSMDTGLRRSRHRRRGRRLPRPDAGICGGAVS